MLAELHPAAPIILILFVCAIGIALYSFTHPDERDNGMRNEQTSKRVASSAGKLLRSCNKVRKLLDQLDDALTEQETLARSVAGSALTQAAPDRSRK